MPSYTAVQDAPIPSILLKRRNARSQLYRGRFLRIATYFATYCEIYKNYTLLDRFDLSNLANTRPEKEVPVVRLAFLQDLVLQFSIEFDVFRSDFDEKYWKLTT